MFKVRVADGSTLERGSVDNVGALGRWNIQTFKRLNV